MIFVEHKRKEGIMFKEFKHWVLFVFVYCFATCVVSGKTLTNEQLLQYLHNFDSAYKAGFSASGTYKRGGMIVKWQFSSSSTESAYQEDVVEAFSPSVVDEFSVLRRVYYWGDSFHAKYDFVGTLKEIGKLTEWSRESPGLAKAGNLMIDDPDATTYKLPLKQIWMSMGRGYSEHIDSIVEIETQKNGLLAVKAIGKDISNRPGAKWELIIDPDSAYMVREANMYSKGKDHPTIGVKNSGTKWHGSLCVPEKNDWRAFFTRLVNNEPYSSISSVTDKELLEYSQLTMKPPFLVHTDYSDQRMTTEYRSQYEAGALFPGDNEDIELDALESDNSDAGKPNADKKNANSNNDIRPKNNNQSSKPEIDRSNESKINDENHNESSTKQTIAIITLVVSSLLLILFLFVKLRGTQK